jgi:hypothetical protein
MLALGATGCSALLDWNDYTGGSGDGGGAPTGEGGLDATSGDAATDAPIAADVIVTCGSGGTCAPGAPSNWMGPVVLTVGAGSPPMCPTGTTDVFDGHGDLVAPAATCSSCSCGAASVTCAGPVLTLYDDPGCTTAAGTTLTAGAACTPVVAAAVTVAAPVATGSCAPSTSVATTTPPTWGTTARACTVGAPPPCSGGGLCVLPSASADVCVMQMGAATMCPHGYPAGPQLFYTGVDDGRACSACSCGAPSGVSCSIASPAVDAYAPGSGCSGTPGVTMSAPATCTELTPYQFVELVAPPSVVGTGSCGVAGGGMAIGMATPKGATSFCCLQ